MREEIHQRRKTGKITPIKPSNYDPQGGLCVKLATPAPTLRYGPPGDPPALGILRTSAIMPTKGFYMDYGNQLPGLTQWEPVDQATFADKVKPTPWLDHISHFEDGERMLVTYFTKEGRMVGQVEVTLAPWDEAPMAVYRVPKAS